VELDLYLHAHRYRLAVFLSGRELPLLHGRNHRFVDLLVETPDHAGIARRAVRAHDYLDQYGALDADAARAGRIIRIDLLGHARRRDIGSERVNLFLFVAGLFFVFGFVGMRRGDQRQQQAQG